jgi:hypothetical protein
MTDPFIPKLHPSEDGTVTLICPQCKKTTKESGERFIAKRGPVEITCSCGNVFPVEIELRSTYRKNMYFDGLYVRTDPKGEWGKMTVKNISLGGLGFEAMSLRHGLQEGETIKVDFNLNDAHNTLIRRHVVIRVINGRYIGCQFIKSKIAMDPEIGFYLKEFLK